MASAGGKTPAVARGKERLTIKTSSAATVAAATEAGSCGLGYLSFLCVGFNSLVNWVFVIQTLPLIANTQLNGENWNNSLLGLFQAVEVLVLLCMLRFGSTSVLGVFAAGVVNAVAAVIFPVLTINSGSSKEFKIVMLHLLCLLLGSCSAVLQGSGFALAGVMPRNYVGAVSAGQGLAGAFTFTVVTVASFLWFDIETVPGTQHLVWLVFSLGGVISIACTCLFFLAMRQTWGAAALRRVAVAAARASCSEVRGKAEDGEEEAGREEREEGEDEDNLVDDTRINPAEVACGEVSVHPRLAAHPLLRPPVSSASTMLTTDGDYAQEDGGVWRRDGQRNNVMEKRGLLKEYFCNSCILKPGEATTTAAATASPAANEKDEEREEEKRRQQGGDAQKAAMQEDLKCPAVCDKKNCRTHIGKQQVTKKTKKTTEQQPPHPHPHADIEQQEDGESAAVGAAAEKELPSRHLTRWQVLRQAGPWLFVLMLHMFISFHLYPKVGPLSWNYNKPVIRNHLIVLFGQFCAAESIGRFLPDLRSFQCSWGRCSTSRASSSGSTTQRSRSSDRDDGGECCSSGSDSRSISREGCLSWLMLSRRALVACEIARLLLFIPFILGYALSNVPVINSFWWYCCLIIVLALTQGWMGTLAFYYSVESVSDADAKKITGPLAAIASPLGCMIGLYTAAPY